LLLLCVSSCGFILGGGHQLAQSPLEAGVFNLLARDGDDKLGALRAERLRAAEGDGVFPMVNAFNQRSRVERSLCVAALCQRQAMGCTGRGAS
jgi:hypothetical protein